MFRNVLWMISATGIFMINAAYLKNKVIIVTANQEPKDITTEINLI